MTNRPIMNWKEKLHYNINELAYSLTIAAFLLFLLKYSSDIIIVESNRQWFAIIPLIIGILGTSLVLITYTLHKKDKKALLNAAEAAITKKGAYSIEPDAKPLRVFISSTMSDLADERQVVHEALKQLPMVVPNQLPNVLSIYAEQLNTNDSSLDEIYLNTLKDADILILIIGERYSPHSEKEYRFFIESGKPVLVFVKKSEQEPSKNIRKFLSNLPLIWESFSSKQELRRKVQFSIVNTLINAYRSKYGLFAPELNIKIKQLGVERSEGTINSFFVDILEQVLSEYRGHETISKVCKEIKYRESEHRDLKFLMFPKRLSIPYNEIVKNPTWVIATFGSSIADGEMNAVFNLILNSDLIEKKSDLEFSKENIISVFKSLNFNPSYVLISNDLFVKWMEIFPDRTVFTEKQIIFKFEQQSIPIIFVINELSSRKILFIKQGSIESIVKCAEDTTPIINFKNDIPIGPRGGKLDIRIKSDGENIEFVFRTVRSLNLIDPTNIFLLDFSKNE